jgi:hypothetical protein
MTPIQPVTVTDADATAHEIATLQSAIRETQKRLYELRAAFSAYMQAENSSVWTDGRVKATLKPGAPAYLVNELRAALGEIVEPEALDKLIVHGEQCRACQGTGTAPDRVDGVAANALKRRGDKYRDALDRNCVRADPSLVVEEVK